MNGVSAITPTTSTEARLDQEITDARESSVSDFNDFLTLLTAQLKNQDPLAPLDSTQFVEQLASFSAVEQQVGTNEKLSRLVAQGAAQEIGELGGWIGQTVDATTALYPLGDDGLSLDVPEQAEAISVEAVISDAEGETIARIPIEDPSKPFVWSGERENGQRAGAGPFAVAFAYEFEGRAPARIDADASGRVVEARIEGEEPTLILDTGAWIRPSDVEALRLASDEAEPA